MIAAFLLWPIAAWQLGTRTTARIIRTLTAKENRPA